MMENQKFIKDKNIPGVDISALFVPANPQGVNATEKNLTILPAETIEDYKTIVDVKKEMSLLRKTQVALVALYLPGLVTVPVQIASNVALSKIVNFVISAALSGATYEGLTALEAKTRNSNKNPNKFYFDNVFSVDKAVNFDKKISLYEVAGHLQYVFIHGHNAYKSCMMCHGE